MQAGASLIICSWSCDCGRNKTVSTFVCWKRRGFCACSCHTIPLSGFVWRKQRKMVYMQTALVLVLTATLCSAIPREEMIDFGAVQTHGLNNLEQPLRLFGLQVRLSQVTMDGVVRLYGGVDGPNPFQLGGELLAYVPRAQKLYYTRYFREVNSKDERTLTKLAHIVKSSIPGQETKEFNPEYAAIWSWTRNSRYAHTFQAILVAQGSTTFLISNYCSDNEDSGDEYPRFAVADGRSKVVVLNERNTLSAVQPSFVLGQDDATREGQYVIRFDSVRCFDQDQFYCLTAGPKNFTTTNVTSRSATLSFMETFDLNLTLFTLPYIKYTLTCVDTYNSTVLAANLKDTQEVKSVPVYNLRPYWEYSCKLVKTVYHDPAGNVTTADPIELRFRTQEDVPEVPPSNVTIVYVNSTSATVTWSPLPPKFQSGVISYTLTVTSDHEDPQTIRNITDPSYQLENLCPGTRYRVTIRASTEVGEGPVSSEQQVQTLSAQPTEILSEPDSSTTVGTTRTYSTEPTVATDDITPSSPTVTDTATQDPTTVKVDDLMVTTEPVSMSVTIIVAIALGGAFLITILVLVVVCACVCVYNYNKKRKTYTVNKSVTELQPEGLSDRILI